MSEAAAAPAGDNGGAEGAVENGATSWTEGLGEESQALINNKGWKGVDDVLTSYRNLEKFVGGAKNLIELPGDDASDDDYSALYAKLGRPDAPDGYEFQAPEGADADLDGWFRQTAHQMGLNEKQAAGLYNAWNEMSVTRLEGMQEAFREQGEADIKALKKEYGKEFDAVVQSGRNAVRALGYDEAALTAIEEKLGTGEMLKLMGKIGSKMGESEFVEGGKSGGFGMTASEAKIQLEDLKADQVFMNRYLSGDQGAVAKYTRIAKVAFGG